MADQDDNDSVKNWKQKGWDVLIQQGIAIVVLVIVSGFFGYYIFQEIPRRDAQWAKVISDQAAEFAKSLEDRDKRFIEYRSAADTKYAATVTSLIASHDKDYDRLERALRGSIDDIRRHSEATAKKVENLMP